MPQPPRHIIRRQILELQGVREEDAHALQEEVRKLLNDKILPLLDQYLTAYSPKEITHQLNTLELDLGAVPRDQLEEGLLQALVEQLAVHFPVGTASETVEPEPVQVSPAKSQLALFSYFIQTGSLPWWADTTSPDPVTESLDWLINNEPRALRSAMHRWVHQERSIQRIVRQLGLSGWTALAALNMAEQSTGIKQLFANLVHRLRQLPPWQANPKHRVYERVGIQLLSWIYLSPEKTKIGPVFWKGLLLQLATGWGISYDQLLAGLQEAEAEDSTASSLSSAIAQLWAEKIEAKEKDDNTDSLNRTLSQQIAVSLKHPSLTPQWKTRFQEARMQLEKGTTDAGTLQHIKALLAEWTSKISIEQNNEKELTSLQRLFVHQVEQALVIPSLSQNGKARLKQALQELKTAALDAGALQRIQTLLAQFAPEVSSREMQAPTGAASKDDNFKDASFNNGEELYVGNAGLVILWPFLTRFFDNLGLLENNMFVDLAATHRAVGLLQFLADGQLEPREYHCGLNKLLCGLDWDEVFDFGEPVTETEAEASQELLQAVIANAPVLGEMSIDGFRGTFLLREGVLRAGMNVWQLNVESKAYDVILDRFPWVWKIVKLPWMEPGMEVVWSDI